VSRAVREAKRRDQTGEKDERSNNDSCLLAHKASIM